MLTVLTHARWPVLEAHLVERALAMAPRPGGPSIAIIVPSSRIARRVQEALASAAPGGAVMGVEVIDLFRLAHEVAGPGGDRTEVFDSDFYVALVEHLVRMKPENFTLVAPTIEFHGMARALWDAVRELREAGLRGEELERFLEGGGLADPAPDWADEVLRVFRAVDAFLETSRIDDRAAVMRRAVASANEGPPGSAGVSPALQSGVGNPLPFSRLLYYGFYELIGLQVELLKALSERMEVEVFACYDPKVKALSFANRFFQDHLSGCPRVTKLPDREVPCAVGDATRGLFVHEGPLPLTQPPVIWNASGASDEVWAVAKGILRLHEDEGIPFHEIGVVASTLDPYAEILPTVFGAARIPFEASCGVPLLHQPYARAVAHLVRCVREDLPRDAVIAFLRSPAKKLPRGARPDRWDFLTRAVGLRGGAKAWKERIGPWTERDFEGDQGDRATRVTKRQADMLLEEVEALARDIASLPERASWERHILNFGLLLSRALVDQDEGLPLGAVMGALVSPIRRDRFSPEVTREEFLSVVAEALESAEAPLGEEGRAGVRVLDLMSARALPFRALFVLGLNEKVFPRTAQEDPFLRDRHRAILRETLGVPLGPKRQRIDEERTILAWTLDAAREQLFLLYQRSDEAGRVAVPSTFLHEVRRVCGVGEDTRGSFLGRVGEWSIPRRWSQKVSCGDEVSGMPLGLLTPREAAAREGFEGRSARGLYQALGWDLSAYDAGRKTREEIESFGAPGARDGILGKKHDLVVRLVKEGPSPTGIETLALCPFRFLVQRGLGLEPLREAEEGTIDPLTRGSLYHSVLEEYYADAVDKGKGFRLDEKRLSRCVDQVFDDHERESPTGLPFLWKLMRRQALADLSRFISIDVDRGKEYRPAYLERGVEGSVEFKMPVRIHGQIDRIDLRVSGEGPPFRVVDYKTGSLRTGKLDTLALKGEKVQLPLYLSLVEKALKLSGGEAMLAYVADEEAADPFKRLTEDFWQVHGAEFRKKMDELLDRIAQGRFVVRKNDRCGDCDYRFGCRRYHAPTLRRSRDELAEEGR